jgi:hypothetical protein
MNKQGSLFLYRVKAQKLKPHPTFLVFLFPLPLGVERDTRHLPAAGWSGSASEFSGCQNLRVNKPLG